VLLKQFTTSFFAACASRLRAGRRRHSARRHCIRTPILRRMPPELATGRLSRPRNVPCEADDDRWQPSKPDWRPWRVSCGNARATPVPIRMGTFRSGPMGSQTKCEIPLCRCGGGGARCRYAREFFPQAQPWVCEIGSHRSVV
jgi:hypothetical protein